MNRDKVTVVAAVALLDQQRRVLTVRKRGTSRFMQPGGKFEPGESAQQVALREVSEEVALKLQSRELIPLGTFCAAAANEPDTIVECVTFLVDAAHWDPQRLELVSAQAEIAETRWIPLDELRTPRDDMAPLLWEKVAPAVSAYIKHPWQ